MGNKLLLDALRKIAAHTHKSKARTAARKAIEAYNALQKWGG